MREVDLTVLEEAESCILQMTRCCKKGQKEPNKCNFMFSYGCKGEVSGINSCSAESAINLIILEI